MLLGVTQNGKAVVLPRPAFRCNDLALACIFAKRLKEERKRAGLSQERLGVLAGIDEMSASARMNQYERGTHEPDFSMVARIATVLNVPEAFFYAKDDDLRLLLVAYHRMDVAQRREVVDLVSKLQPEAES